MEVFGPMKLKRKELDDVSDDFSNFSLCSPARKIRRLDAELPPIVEDEPEIPIAVKRPLLQEDSPFGGWPRGIKIEELPSVPSDNEKAIVLFNPMNNTTLPRPLSSYSVSFEPNFASTFKNQVPWSNQSNHWKLNNAETMKHSNSNGCLALIPWVAPHASTEAGNEIPSETTYLEMMDAQEMPEEKMDVEEGTGSGYFEQMNIDGTVLNEGFRQWPQQHCLIPQRPQNSTAPIVWYR